MTTISSRGHRKLVCSKSQKACSSKAVSINERKGDGLTTLPGLFPSLCLRTCLKHIKKTSICCSPWMQRHTPHLPHSPCRPFVFWFTKNKIKLELVPFRGRENRLKSGSNLKCSSSMESNQTQEHMAARSQGQPVVRFSHTMQVTSKGWNSVAWLES